mgnify:CR=1 FL=1
MALKKFGTFRTLAEIRIPSSVAARRSLRRALRTRLRRVGLRSRTSCCISLLSTSRKTQHMGRPSTTKSREGRVNNPLLEKRTRDEADEAHDDTVANFNPAAGHPLPRPARSGAVREIELSNMAAVARPDDEGQLTSPGRTARARRSRMTRSRARTRFVHRVGRRAVAGPRHEGPRGSAWLRAAAKPRRGGRSRRLVTPTSPARHCRAALAATFSRHSHAPPILRILQIAQIARR